MTTIEFENTGTFITARDDSGAILIRCNFDHADCGETENLDGFTRRHGGPDATAAYLKQRHAEATNP